MIKITNAYCEQLTNPAAAQALAALAARPWPIKTAYWLNRILKETQARANDYMAAKTDLLNRHADVTDPDPQGRIMAKGWKTSQADYTKDLQELLAIEIALPFEPVTLPLEGDIKLTINEMMLLDPLVKALPDQPPASQS